MEQIILNVAGFVKYSAMNGVERGGGREPAKDGYVSLIGDKYLVLVSQRLAGF